MDLGGVSTVAGDLTLSATGDGVVGISGPAATLDVAGNTLLDAGSNSIVLTGAGNDFTTVAVVSATDVALVDGDTLVLGPSASTVMGNLSVTLTTGDLSTTGALRVSGDSIFTANGAGSSITVDDAGNDFNFRIDGFSYPNFRQFTGRVEVTF